MYIYYPRAGQPCEIIPPRWQPAGLCSITQTGQGAVAAAAAQVSAGNLYINQHGLAP